MTNKLIETGVTQADRDAAADTAPNNHRWGELVRHGHMDSDPIVQKYRAHRVASILAIIPELAELAAGAADDHTKARYAARDNAKQRKAGQEARDHESMAIEGVHIAQAIRARFEALAKKVG